MGMLVSPHRHATSGGGTPPTPPTATYEYDYTGRPWTSAATGPSALYDSNSDKTYVVWEAQAQFRHTRIASYNHATGTWSAPSTIDSYTLADDDHGLAALEILSDGRLVCFYGSHNTNQEWSISAQSGGVPDITSWTRQTALSGNYGYPKPLNIGSGGGAGTLYLLLRKNSVSSYPLIIKTATYTSGGAVSFGADKEIVNFDNAGAGRVYAMEARLNSGNIEFLATRADGSDATRQSVYYFRYIVSTGAIQNLSGGVSTASGSQPINLTTANSSYREKTSAGSNVTGTVSWCRDTNGYLHISYGDDTTNPWNVTHDWHNGTSWQGETTAFTVDRKGSAGYVEDWCLVPRGTSVDAYYPKGGSFTGRGGTDMARKTWNGSWGSEVTVLAGGGTNALGHPTAVKSADADFRVMFSEISQTDTIASFAAFKRYFLGDSGFLEWPAPSDPDAYKNLLVLNFGGADGATTTADESGWKSRRSIAFLGNAQLDNTLAPPWGTAWLKLDGTGDYLTVTQSRAGLPDGGDWDVRGNDTVEVVFRLNELGRTQYLVSTRPLSATAEGFALVITSTNTLQIVGWSAGSVVVNIAGATTMSIGPTYTGSFKRTTGGWELFLNGVSQGTAATADTSPGLATLDIGRNTNSAAANNFNGWIKQIRWTKLANRTLTTAPTADFPVS